MNNKKGNKNNKMIQVYQGQGSQGHSVILCLLWEYQGADLQGGEHGGTWEHFGPGMESMGMSKYIKTCQNYICQTAKLRSLVCSCNVPHIPM